MYFARPAVRVGWALLKVMFGEVRRLPIETLACLFVLQWCKGMAIKDSEWSTPLAVAATSSVFECHAS